MHLYVYSSSKWTANVHNDHFLTLYEVTNGGICCSYDKNWLSMTSLSLTFGGAMPPSTKSGGGGGGQVPLLFRRLCM